MINIQLIKFSLFISIILFIGCSRPSPFDHIKSSEAKAILEKGIESAGGLNNWKNSPGYKFNKRSILYLKDGAIESKNTQIVEFKDHPSLTGRITWNNRTDTVNTRVDFSDGAAIKYVDNIDQGATVNEAARRSFLGAHIVMTLPFKLLDPGVHLDYGGQQTLFDKSVEVLIADYDAKNENHTETHRWWHYFDAETYEYIGYKVFHPPTYALVENLSTTTINGITYPLDRITWRVDSLNNKQFIRAKFAYSDFESLAK